jgi:SAM-dependent methyltransferase/uncharacterized protein YbaR (Trm112 family)
VKPALLETLACPLDGTPFVLRDSAGADGEVERGTLACEYGHLRPVEAFVPRIVGEDRTPDDQEGTEESFGAKWRTLRDEDQDALITFLHRWYDERYGFGDDDGLRAFLAGREMVLDAGCGLGRDVARYARLSDAQVVGFDLSDAVTRAHRDFGAASNAHYVQADILAPPFRPESFDFVIADQVIHHTPDTPRAFATLSRLVRPGGQIAAYVYKLKPLVRELSDIHIREQTTRMSVEDCMAFSEQITELGRELSNLDAKITLEKGIPLLGIAPGEHDVQRLLYWNFLKCFWNEELGQDLSVLVNFDWYHPPYASRHTPEEVRGWCTDAGLEIVHMDVIDSGISFRAEKPR